MKTKTTTKSAPQTATETTPKPIQTAELEVRRCCVCGAMSTIGGDLEFSEILTLDGIAHQLAVCKRSGACVYGAAVLKERLEFRDVERVHVKRSEGHVLGTALVGPAFLDPKVNPEKFIDFELVMNDEQLKNFNTACDCIRRNHQVAHPGQVLTEAQCIEVIMTNYTLLQTESPTKN